MNKSHLIGALSAVLFTFITVSANAALVGRLALTPGGSDYQAAYDDVLDITWVTNAALSGPNNWDNQVAWASGLNYLGFDDWRLASMSVAAGVPTGTATSVAICSSSTQAACEDSELGYMYYYNLGGTTGNDLTGTQAVGDVTLTDVQTLYWSGTEFDSVDAWNYLFNFGDEANVGKNGIGRYGWAVADGDVFVPIPAAFWLFGSGLLGLVGMARRKKA